MTEGYAEKTKNILEFTIGLMIVLLTYKVFVLEALSYEPRLGYADWDFFAAQLQIVSSAVFKFHQFPWWNPMSSGGYPFFASPIFGVFSLSSFISLIFGVLRGIALSVVLHAIIGYAGCYVLLGRASKNALFRAAGSSLFCCNGGILLHLSVGHAFWDYFYFPWILHFFLNISPPISTNPQECIRSSLIVGALMSAIAYTFIGYGFIYIGFTLVALGITELLRSRRPKVLWRLYALAASLFVALAGFRIVMALMVNRDYPRNSTIPSDLGWKALAYLFLKPGQTTLMTPPDFIPTNVLGWFEIGSYIGIVPVVLFFFSMKKRIRYFHVFVILVLFLFVFTSSPWPFFWLNKYVPFWQAMRVAPRIRIWMMPFLALAVTTGLDESVNIKILKRWFTLKQVKNLSISLSLFILGDLYWNGVQALENTYNFAHIPQHPVISIANTKPYPITFNSTVPRQLPMSLYEAYKNFYVAIPGNEPTLSALLYGRKNGSALGYNEPLFRGHFYTDDGQVEPIVWSPNRILFTNIFKPLHINANPSSYWTINGMNPFKQLKVADINHSFTALPDQNGKIELKIIPKGWKEGLLASLLGGIALLFFFRNEKNKFSKCIFK